MKIKVDDINYDVEFNFPDKLQNAISVKMSLDTWAKLIEKERLIKLRELRVEKIKKINDRLD